MSKAMEDFDTFLKRREAVSGDYINGNADTLAEISTLRDPATFYPPTGQVITGPDAVGTANAEGAKLFKPGSTGRFEVLQSGSSGDLGYWTGRQHVQAMMQGKNEPVRIVLRVTESFRREDGAWKLAHRHADVEKE